MSTRSLRSQLKEDYLTCSICFNSFIKPKALPCLHTFCEDCLRDYVVSRGYESLGLFPCPVCRTNTPMPDLGVEGFPDNHLMCSLSDTVENSEPSRPMPKPRRSLGQPQLQKENDEKLSPPYFTVSDTNPHHSTDSATAKICLNDSEPDWVMIPIHVPSAPVSDGGHDEKSDLANGCTEYVNVSVSHSGAVSQLSSDKPADMPPQVDQTAFSNGHSVIPVQPPPYNYVPQLVNPSVPIYPHLPGYSASGGTAVPVGWNLNILGDNTLSGNVHPQSAVQGKNEVKSFSTHDPQGNQTVSHMSSRTSQTLYPTVPTHSEQSNVACTENLLLRFGKQGSSIRDFMKPVGLAVSKEGNYIISDSSGDQNRIFIFNSGGELISAFNCGCKVKDVTMTKGNEILAAVHRNASAVRHFTMTGQCKGEYGKFFTFEEPCGIGQLTNGGVALTGTQNYCVYVLTDQMKLATKFGRKGNGDGYFQYPAYIAVDSKNHIIVTDKINNCVQVFNADGKFKLRFGTSGKNHGQLHAPLGLCVDDNDNILVADSGNCRVEVFSSRGRYLSSVVTNTHELGDNVKPVNVAFTPTGKVAVLLRGPYFAEVRIYMSRHKQLAHKEGPVSTTSALWYSKN